MALTVEDGRGLPNADSFISLDYARTRWQSYCYDLSAFNELQQEAAIRRATQYLSESFRWKGLRRYDRNDSHGYQALAWPRYGVYDREGAYIEDDVIPREIMQATAEAAWYELNDVGGLQPSYIAHDRVKMEKAGPVTITYDTSRQDAWGSRPVLLLVMDLIGEFLDERSGNRYSGISIRR